MDLPQRDGIQPVLKQTLKRTCKKHTEVSFFKTSTGILSIPCAYPFLHHQ